MRTSNNRLLQLIDEHKNGLTQWELKLLRNTIVWIVDNKRPDLLYYTGNRTNLRNVYMFERRWMALPDTVGNRLKLLEGRFCKRGVFGKLIFDGIESTYVTEGNILFIRKD